MRHAALQRGAAKLVERVRHAAEVGRETASFDGEDGEMGNAVEVAQVALEDGAEVLADATRVEDEPVADPALPLLVRVAGGEHGRVAEQLEELVVRSRRLHSGDARGGGAVHAEQAAAVAEVELVGIGEGG